MTAADTDALLIDRIKRGDVRAFEMLVVKYQRRIERLIGRMVRDTDLVQDIAQETFIRAYRAIGQFRGESAFYTWLYRIAINTAKNALVASRRRPVSYDLDLQDSSQLQAHARLADDETPEALALTDEIRRTVNESIEALPDDLRLAIVLRELEGMSYEEIAKTMECPVGTVRSRIFRAREAIDRSLREVFDGGLGRIGDIE